ncbi:MAG: type 2 isopentenyl-diphosphate Delta-isomerase [Chloroflexota bacterium]|nr:type 2 isopentenyl-diphosphate Delta-isomerase [Chloroflexota bacterium]
MLNRRKAEHLRIALKEDVQFKGLASGFERYHFLHCALPELDRDEIDLSIALFGKHLKAPLVISAMTGGTELAGAINENLAQAAQELGIAMEVGSQRAAIEEPTLASSYQVRHVAPDILLFANLGAVQLNYGYGIEECRRVVEVIEADGLVLHLNPLQECLQFDGNTDFAGLLPKVEEVCRGLSVPVIVKEVGWGISEEVAKKLASAGVAGIEVAGAGGTSWSEIEKRLAPSESMRRIAESFADWGIPTAESILMARRGAPDTVIIGSGGIRTGVDAAKAIALGADAVGFAHPLLKPATISAEAVMEQLRQIIEELRIAMFCVGTRDLATLKSAPLQQLW